MDINLIKRLIRVVEKSEITEFSIQEGDLKLKISKNHLSSGKPSVVYTNSPSVVESAQAQTPQIETSPAKPPETAEDSLSKELYEVKSPIVGTFYRAPSPEAEPYVKVGDKIAPGTVLCIIEAMKLMNEIESEVSGTIAKVLVENGKPVEYNQPLFLIEED